VRSPERWSQSSRLEICVLLPAPSIPEKLIIVTEVSSRIRWVCLCWVCHKTRSNEPLGLAASRFRERHDRSDGDACSDDAAVLITIVRTRRCLAGATATPAGCDAAIPAACVGSAAAVPTGFCGDGC